MKRQLRIPVLILLLLAAWLVSRTAAGSEIPLTVQPIGPIVYSWNAPYAAADDDDDDDITPRLSVRGEAELEKPADQLRISLGVITDGKDADQTLQDNNKAMEDVVKAIRKAGLEDGEYQTGRFRVQPIYSRRPRGADDSWQPQIIGYKVSNTINIKTKQLDLAGALIQQASKAGANSISAINFDLADERTHRAEAIEKATTNAITDARVLSHAAGVRLVRVLSINLDHARPMVAPPRNTMMMARGMTDGGSPTPITPGDVVVRASVTIVYEIEDEVRHDANARRDDDEQSFGLFLEIPF